MLLWTQVKKLLYNVQSLIELTLFTAYIIHTYHHVGPQRPHKAKMTTELNPTFCSAARCLQCVRWWHDDDDDDEHFSLTHFLFPLEKQSDSPEVDLLHQKCYYLIYNLVSRLFFQKAAQSGQAGPSKAVSSVSTKGRAFQIILLIQEKMDVTFYVHNT